MTTDLERRRANGWRDDQPDRICMHGVNVSVEGTCDACMKRLDDWLAERQTVRPRPRVHTWTADRSSYKRGYDAGYKAGMRRASSESPR